MELHQWDEHEGLVSLIERKCQEGTSADVASALHSLSLQEIQEQLNMTDAEKVSLVGQVWDLFITCEYPPSPAGARWDDTIFPPTIIALMERDSATHAGIIDAFSDVGDGLADTSTESESKSDDSLHD